MTSSTGLPALTMMMIGRGLASAATKSGMVLAGTKRPSDPCVGDQFVGPRAMAIVDRDAEAFSRGVARQIRAHGGESKDADVSLLSHVSSLAFPDDAVARMKCEIRRMLVDGNRGNAFRSPVRGVKRLSHPLAVTLSVRVYYEDTDFSGCVYHASYLRFLERGRTEWLRGHGFAHRDFAESSGVFFAVRSLQIDYLGPALMDDCLASRPAFPLCAERQSSFGNGSFVATGQLVTAQVLVAAIRDGRPMRIPASLRRLLNSSS